MNWKGFIGFIVWAATLLSLVAYLHFLKSESPPTYINEEEEVGTSTTGMSDDFVLVTAAHLSEDKFEGYTLVYKDEENDRAVYVATGDIPTPTLTVSETVYFNGLACTVSSVDEQGFTIKLPSDALARKGMSGSPVYRDYEMLGVVSKAVSLYEIYVTYV